MQTPPKVGSSFERSFVVEEAHLIPFADAQMPAVLATPHLIWELEKTAREAVTPCLEPHERTVGVEVEIRHLAPSLLGMKVTCLVRVLRVEGDEILFQVEARDELDLLARGTHRRKVVDTARLRRRVERKAQAWKPSAT